MTCRSCQYENLAGARPEGSEGATALKVRYPHIVSRKGYCGGSPVIAGTKFPVRSVVRSVLRQGMTPEELVSEFPHLSLAQVYDALSYYYDHQKEVDREFTENAEDAVRSQSGR